MSSALSASYLVQKLLLLILGEQWVCGFKSVRIENPVVNPLIAETRASLKINLIAFPVRPVDAERSRLHVLVHLYHLRRATDGFRMAGVSKHVTNDFERLP